MFFFRKKKKLTNKEFQCEKLEPSKEIINFINDFRISESNCYIERDGSINDEELFIDICTYAHDYEETIGKPNDLFEKCIVGIRQVNIENKILSKNFSENEILEIKDSIEIESLLKELIKYNINHEITTGIINDMAEACFYHIGKYYLINNNLKAFQKN